MDQFPGRKRECPPMMEVTETGPAAGLQVHLYPDQRISLSKLKLVLSGFALLCLALGAVFYFLGATPVPGFMGLEVVLLFAVYRYGANRARIGEWLSLEAETLSIRRQGHRGQDERFDLATRDLHLELAGPNRQTQRLWLGTPGQVLEIGAFLAPSERAQLAGLLEKVLGRAPFFSSPQLNPNTSNME